MTNDIFKYIDKFFNSYLKNEINASDKTIESYKDVFKLLFIFINAKCDFKVKNFSMKYFTRDLILNFLTWLEEERANGITTRNNRLAVLKSFTNFIIQFEVANSELTQILRIPRKKEVKRQLKILEEEQVELLLQQPDIKSKKGRRQLAILSLLYDSAVRISELLDLKVLDVKLEEINSIEIWHGKGDKHRIVPISDDVADIIRIYMKDYQKFDGNEYLFTNSRKERLTSNAIRKIIKKYAEISKEKSNNFPIKVHPHMFRHSKATHLINKNVSILETKELLGHDSLESTKIYITTNISKKRVALETIECQIIPNDSAIKDDTITPEEWLDKLV